MKWIIALLIILLVALQARLWIGEGSLAQISALSEQLEKQSAKNAALKARNDQLDARVKELKAGMDAVEELARGELGLVKENETFFMVIEQ